MAQPVIMPRQGQSVESCIISKWHKREGDQVNAGDLLFSYETDKAGFDEESKTSGTILKIYSREGDDVPCLQNVCVIGNPGDDISEFNPVSGKPGASGEASREKAGEAPKVEAETETPEPIRISGSEEHIKISPRAKNAAEKSGADIRFARPSGPNGRIIEKDVEELAKSGPVFTRAAAGQSKPDNIGPLGGTGIGGRVTIEDLKAGRATEAAKIGAPASQPAVMEVKLPNIRKLIARTMLQSLSSSAQLTLDTSYDATVVMEFRKRIKEGKEKLGLENITLNDIILYAVSRTLPRHRDLNANLVDDTMTYFENVNLGVATDTERGLMVPVIRDANLKSLNEISQEVKRLVKECQSGSINPDLLKGGSFTVTNLGTLGVESFTPVINPPQTGILGVNNITWRVKEADGAFINYPAMGLSLTFDHRALDGAPAARFLQDLVKCLENFSAFLAI